MEFSEYSGEEQVVVPGAVPFGPFPFQAPVLSWVNGQLRAAFNAPNGAFNNFLDADIHCEVAAGASGAFVEVFVGPVGPLGVDQPPPIRVQVDNLVLASAHAPGTVLRVRARVSRA